jgi:inosine/xanthosine triphosphate pyrophosphatase family protein
MEIRHKITLVSGNKDKLEEFRAILGDVIDLVIEKVKLPEFQGDP